MAAPRVLQALARDRVLPEWLSALGQGSGPNDEPKIGTIVTLGVAIAAVCVGDLNLIAPVLTMFFLTTYMVLNLSASIEGFLQSPSFRPSFPVHWLFSLLGAVGCFVVMVLIDARATVVAAVIILCIYFWLQRQELEVAWGDVRRGLWMALLRTGIFQISHSEDPKNWRPHVLVLSGAPQKRWPLIELADDITHHRGLVTVSSILPIGSRDVAQQTELEITIRDYLERRGVQALVRLITAPDPFEGAQRLVEAYGLGPLIPNTVLLGDSEQVDKREQYCQMITKIHQAKRNILILRHHPEQDFGYRRRIDVWWGGLQANGGLMLLLAYLLRSNIKWRYAQVYLKLVVADEMAAQVARTQLQAMVEKLRVGALSQVLVSEGRPFYEILQESSPGADLIFLGLAKPQEGFDFRAYYERLHERTSGLPTTIFSLAAPGFAFQEVLSE